jgi:hypothetical protein
MWGEILLKIEIPLSNQICGKLLKGNPMLATPRCEAIYLLYRVDRFVRDKLGELTPCLFVLFRNGRVGKLQ